MKKIMDWFVEFIVKKVADWIIGRGGWVSSYISKSQWHS